MAKKSRVSKGRSKKWSRANTMNFVLGGIVAVSMLLGSVFAFGGASLQPAPAAATVPIVATAPPPVVQPASSPTPEVTVTVAVTPTLASPTPLP